MATNFLLGGVNVVGGAGTTGSAVFLLGGLNTAPVPATTTTVQVDVGGTASPTGWVKEGGYGGNGANAGGVAASTNATANLPVWLPAKVAQTERYGAQGYSVPVRAGTYTVDLAFVERYDPNFAPGKRVFDANIAGQHVNSIDVYKTTGGGNRALVVTRTVTLLTDGTIDVALTPHGAGDPFLSALRVMPVPPTLPSTATLPQVVAALNVLLVRMQATSGSATVPAATLSSTATLAQVRLAINNILAWQAAGSTAVTTPPSVKPLVGVGVLDAATTSQYDEVKASGGNLVMVQAYWDREQSASGAELTPSVVAERNALIDYALAAGMRVVLRIGQQYTPSWVQAAVPKFKAQDGSTWDSTNPGEAIRDWVWSAVGATALHDFATKVIASLGATRRGKLTAVQTGLGMFGETSLPPVGSANPYKYWGFSAPAQTGTGLAPDQVVCPTPGHQPFAGVALGTAGSSTTLAFVAWYRTAVRVRMNSLVTAVRAGGWTGPVHVLHPSFGVRSNWTSADPGWREQNAQGVDWDDQIGHYADAAVYPWCTDVGKPDPTPGGSADSDISAGAKIAQLAQKYGRGAWLGGENTGGGTLADQNRLFDDFIRFGYQLGLDAFESTLHDGSGDTIANFAARAGAATKAAT